MEEPPDPFRFIRDNLGVTTLPILPQIRLYLAHRGSGLSRLSAAPYWAYPWAGGLALARFLLDRPETVAGRRVLDFGAGSGLVAIVAARCGARHVAAAEIDRYALAAIAANAALNDVGVKIVQDLRDPPDDIDLILAGDVFYARAVGRRSLALLDRCRAAAIEVLIGDPFRPDLPRDRLRLLAEYLVPDMGSRSRTIPSGVFALAGPTGGRAVDD